MASVAALPSPTRVTPADTRVQTISTFDTFLDLEPAWNELLARADVSHPFLEHLWLRTWWECFGDGHSLHILVVKSGDELIAIAPLIASTVRIWGIKVRQLGFFYNSHVPRADFIVARGHDHAYSAIWRHLRSHGNWDLLQLCQLPLSSATLEQIHDLATRDKRRTGVWKSGASPYVALGCGWEEYYAKLAAKHRSNLRNRFKRVNQGAATEIETVSARDKVLPALEEGLELEAAAWKRDAGTAISCDGAISRFYALFAERAADRGWLRLNFLRSGQARIAFDYSLLYRNQVFLLKLGYDPKFSQYSPSNLLLSLALQDAFGRGCETYDFLGEEAEWKRCWTEQARPNVWLFVFSGSFKGWLIHLIKFRIVPVVRKDSFLPIRRLARRLTRA